MRLIKPSLYALRVALIAAAVLFGMGSGLYIVPESLKRAGAGAAFTILFTIAGAVLFVGLDQWTLRIAGDMKGRLDRDLLAAFLEHIPDNVFFKDRESRFLRISKSMAAYCGLANPEEAVGKTDADIFSSEHAEQALADEQQIMQAGSAIAEKEEKETWPDGHETWVLTTKVPLKNHAGRVIGTMGIAHNITDRKQAELQVRHMALHDSLTGLPNRLLLEDRISHATAMAVRNRQRGAVLMLDLDRFKNVNDSFGHYVGDRLLEAVAERLKQCLRESDTIGRLGGDEFVIVIPDVSDREAIERVSNKILDSLSAPFRIESHTLQISASIGISRFPYDGDRPGNLLQFADSAMYEAKGKGRGHFYFFSPALTEATRYRQRMENDLLQACAGKEFVLHYQPFVDANSGSVSAVEALLRWQHPQLGIIAPNQFIPQLEDMGRMVEVGRWVLRTACRQSVEWQQLGLPAVRMAVNVSAQQFYQGNIIDTVASALRETGMNPKLLELELTESRSLDDSEATVRLMRGLKRLGVSLSLDDFGTGWSSLSYLRQFPVDRLKIDRSFVRDVVSQPGAQAVVKSILGLGKNLGIACVAEGVETPEERDCLKKLTCTEIQGFLVSRPLTAVDTAALLRSGQPESRGLLNVAHREMAAAHI